MARSADPTVRTRLTRHALRRARVLLRGAALLCATGGALAAPLQNALAPAGPQAVQFKSLWDITLLICTLVFLAVTVATAIAVGHAARRRRASVATPPVLAVDVPTERRMHRSVAAAVVGSTLLLLFLIVASVLTDRALARMSLQNALHIEVTANQWWWEARYDDPQASRMFSTANELHVPVGRPVIMSLKSNDVIHSLWVPNLGGKKDLIPGRSATMQFQADRAGSYRGQCAEFCGYQHANMAFVVVAEPPDKWQAWADRQRAPAAEPASPELTRGRDLFMSTTCAMCHSILGTSANAQRAPDLTHVASRATIAAGTLPNTEPDLTRWIRSPQQIKPGSNMPASDLADDDLKLIVGYLRSLR